MLKKLFALIFLIIVLLLPINIFAQSYSCSGSVSCVRDCYGRSLGRCDCDASDAGQDGCKLQRVYGVTNRPCELSSGRGSCQPADGIGCPSDFKVVGSCQTICTCPNGQRCTNGSCYTPPPVPYCPTGKCGASTNGVGGSNACGGCSSGYSCASGWCTPTVTGPQGDNCRAYGLTCGASPNGYGGPSQCGICGSTSRCVSGTCVPNVVPPGGPNCGTRICGPSPNGFGSSNECGTCGGYPGTTCNVGTGQCITTNTSTTPDCTGLQCGPASNGIGGTFACGNCSNIPGTSCNTSGQCQTQPTNPIVDDCGLRQCGPSPLGTKSCGTCPANSTCNSTGQCIPNGVTTGCDIVGCNAVCCPGGGCVSVACSNGTSMEYNGGPSQCGGTVTSGNSCSASGNNCPQDCLSGCNSDDQQCIGWCNAGCPVSPPVCNPNPSCLGVSDANISWSDICNPDPGTNWLDGTQTGTCDGGCGTQGNKTRRCSVSDRPRDNGNPDYISILSKYNSLTPSERTQAQVNNNWGSNGLIGKNSPVVCSDIVRVIGKAKVNSSTFSDNTCIQNSGNDISNGEVEFEMICTSGDNMNDNKNWNYVIRTNNITITSDQLTANTSVSNGIGNVRMTNKPMINIGTRFVVRFGITYNEDIPRRDDNITVTVNDGGSAYNSIWQNQSQYQAQLSDSKNITQTLDTRSPHIDLALNITAVDKFDATFRAQDASGLLTHAYYCSPSNPPSPVVAPNQANQSGYISLYKNNPFRQLTDNQILNYSSNNNCNFNSVISGNDWVVKTLANQLSDERKITYTLVDKISDQTEPFVIHFGNGYGSASVPPINQNISDWYAIDNFCNRTDASDTFNTSYSGTDVSRGVKLDVGSPWLQTLDGNVFASGENQIVKNLYNDRNINFKNNIAGYSTIFDYSINDIVTNTNLCDVSSRDNYIFDNKPNTCPNENDDFVSTLYSINVKNSPTTNISRLSKFNLDYVRRKTEIFNVEKFTESKFVSYFDYFKDIILKNKNSYKSSIRGVGNCSRYYTFNGNLSLSGGGNISDSLIALTKRNDINGQIIVDISDTCNNGVRAIFVDGDLNINSGNWNINTSTLILVSGNTYINPDITKVNVDNNLLIVSKGNIELLGGTYKSQALNINQYPLYDRIDAYMISDGKLITYKDNLGIAAAGKVWDGLKINGGLFITNDNGNTVSSFGRDLVLTQNFIAPSEIIRYDPSIYKSFGKLLGVKSEYSIKEVGYDPRN